MLYETIDNNFRKNNTLSVFRCLPVYSHGAYCLQHFFFCRMVRYGLLASELLIHIAQNAQSPWTMMGLQKVVILFICWKKWYKLLLLVIYFMFVLLYIWKNVECPFYDWTFWTADVKIGDELLVDGGMVRFEVIEKIGPDVKCRCTDPGLLLPRANLTFWRDGSLVRERNAMLPTVSSKVSTSSSFFHVFNKLIYLPQGVGLHHWNWFLYKNMKSFKL